MTEGRSRAAVCCSSAVQRTQWSSSEAVIQANLDVKTGTQAESKLWDTGLFFLTNLWHQENNCSSKYTRKLLISRRVHSRKTERAADEQIYRQTREANMDNRQRDRCKEKERFGRQTDRQIKKLETDIESERPDAESTFMPGTKPSKP